MKKKLLSIVLALALVSGLAFTAAACKKDNPVAVERVTINGASTVTVNQEVTYTATVLPENAKDKTVAWAVVSGGTATAAINETSGLFKATTTGTVTIKATADGKSDTKTITVNMITLAVPTGLEIAADDLLTWDNITSASGYKVDVDGTEYDAASNEFDISDLELTTAGVYKVKVRALGDGTTYTNSDFSDEVWHIVGTDGLDYAPINEGTEYRVSAGTIEDGDVFIPKYHNGKPITIIGGQGFWNNPHTLPITSVTISASVKTIEGHAFYLCTSLESVTFEKGSQLETIGEIVFGYCTKIESIEIPASVKTIGGSAFLSCGKIENITFEKGSQLETIDENAFNGCTKIESITIPTSVQTIGSNPFALWTAAQTINVLGFSSQTDADTAWGENWRKHCNAVIEYKG